MRYTGEEPVSGQIADSWLLRPNTTCVSVPPKPSNAVSKSQPVLKLMNCKGSKMAQTCGTWDGGLTVRHVGVHRAGVGGCGEDRRLDACSLYGQTVLSTTTLGNCTRI